MVLTTSSAPLALVSLSCCRCQAPTLWLCTTGTKVPQTRTRKLVGPTPRVECKLGFLSLREKAEAAEEARSLPPSSAASVRSSHDWLWENCGLVSPSRFRRRDLGDEAPPAPDFFAEASGVGPIQFVRTEAGVVKRPCAHQLPTSRLVG